MSFPLLQMAGQAAISFESGQGFQVLLKSGKCAVHFPCLLRYKTNIKRMCRISAHPFYYRKRKYFNSDIVRQVSQ